MSSLDLQKVQVKKHGRNTFDLTHDVKMSGKFGALMPCMVMECIPGDNVKIASESLIRFAPLLAPIMHKIDVRQEYFAVPYRLIWGEDNMWQRFIVADENPPAHPFITLNDTLTDEEKKFLDYLGIPPFPATGGVARNVSPFAMAAYQMIYNEYYRDQNLIDEVDYKLDAGNNNGVANAKRTELLKMRYRAWEHDQFTSCLPDPQKGDPVQLPLGTITLATDWQTVGEPNFKIQASGTTAPRGYVLVQDNPTAGIQSDIANPNGPYPANVNSPVTVNGMVYDPMGTLEVGATTINDLRTAIKVQEWLEANARGGTRYIEAVSAHFGVTSDDARMQRPEYIVGSKSPVVISEVLNTTGTNDLPQGNMAGHGVSVGDGYLGSYFAKEHCVIIGIVSIMPKTAYQQGIPKFFLKDDQFDYAWPEMANLGEEAVRLEEIYAYTPNAATTFGYLPRYYDYKQLPSRVAGDFREDLNFWHLSRIFASEPALNQEFIECIDTVDDLTRIFAVEDGHDYIWMHILNKVKASRLLPTYGTPML